MTIWQGGLIILVTLAVFPSIYALYRLFRWMKQRGWLSWRNQRTESSAMSCFVAMQQMIEPAVKHVHELKTRRRGGENSPMAMGSSPDGTQSRA